MHCALSQQKKNKSKRIKIDLKHPFFTHIGKGAHSTGGTIDQFSNLEVIAGRILGCYEHGPTFFVREILDGIVAKPGGDYIHSVCRHRQALQQSRLKYHGLPGPPLVRADNES